MSEARSAPPLGSEGGPIYPNDEWTLELEELGFDRQARELANLVLNCAPPFTVSVQGRWGSGKTSIMRYAMALLGGGLEEIRIPYQQDSLSQARPEERDKSVSLRDSSGGFLGRFRSLGSLFSDAQEHPTEAPRVSTVWFSPWRYQNEPDPLLPLLHTVRAHFSRWANTREGLKRELKAAVDGGIELLEHLLDSTAGSLGFKTKAFTAAGRAIDASVTRHREERLEDATHIERFNLLFEHAVATVLAAGRAKNPNDRLVIFIDDLDRCEGPAAVQMLEAIKLQLSTKNCVFVLGVDPLALEHSIQEHWDRRPRGLSGQYLEKLFQAAIHVPSGSYARYIDRRLAAVGWITPSTEGEDPPTELAETLARIIEPNPRRVKNFLNSLFLAWRVREASGTPAIDRKAFLLMTRLRSIAPKSYSWMAQDPVPRFLDLQAFFGAALARADSGIEEDSPVKPRMAIGRQVFLLEFGHICRDVLSESHPLGLDDLTNRLDRQAADLQFASEFIRLNDGMTGEQFESLLMQLLDVDHRD